MAKPLLIEQLKLQELVAKLVSKGHNPQQIAEACSKKADRPISNMAVRRYLASLSDREGESIMEEPQIRPLAKKTERRMQLDRIVESGLDIINLQYRTTSVLVDKFETMIDLPDAFERRVQVLEEEVRENGIDTSYLTEWRTALANDIRRNIQTITTINRELRENSKFIVDLREKAFQQNLAQEFVDHFMEIFQRKSPEAFDAAMLEVAANPRLQRIVEQQLRGVAG